MKQLEELLNMIHSFSSVRRYSNKTLIKDENIAEHSSIVGIISMYLYSTMTNENKEGVNLDRLLASCIFHDFDEIYSGDVLRPVKYFKPEIKEGIDEYAILGLKKYSEMIGSTLFLDYSTPSKLLNNLEYDLLKLSDLMSVFIKFRIEGLLGNKLIGLDYNNLISGFDNYAKKFMNYDDNLVGLCLQLKQVCSEEATKVSHLINIGNINDKKY